MKYLYVGLMAILSITSCKEKEGNRDTELLEQYLHKQFNAEIAKDNSTYVLLSDQACSGCARYIFREAKVPHDKFIFILPRPSDNYIYNHPNVLIDSSANLGRLKFHRGNVCTIKTHDGLVTEVRVYDPSEVKDIFK
ncbi:hypothetical protein [Edaphocola flava]|uniref:hypothetical protein n=1 Tax=Edaphocola flava TaxID=2499629 RepID=UPI00100B12EA|nr:hypothetical protein [Edaphocola flava]